MNNIIRKFSFVMLLGIAVFFGAATAHAASPVSSSSQITAPAYLGGVEDMPGANSGEGQGDYNDMIFSFSGANAITVQSADGAMSPLTSNLVNESGTIFWNNPSLDGPQMNVGFCLTGTGNCSISGAPYSNLQYYSAASNAQVDDATFSTTGPVTMTLLAKISAYAPVLQLGWYDPSNPSVRNVIFSGASATGTTATFTPSPVFALYADNGHGGNFSSIDADNVGDATTQQHFAFFGYGVPVTPTSTVADLSITKTVDNATPSEGNTINYTLTVAAAGPATSTNVVATDVLPSGETFVGATSSVGSYASSTGTWTIGDMSASSSATLTIAATINAGEAGQTITNTATVGESANETNNSSSTSASVPVTVAQNGGGSSCTLSAIDFTNALASGTISFTPIAITSSTTSITVTNHTNCSANLLFGSNEMFVPIGGPNWLSSQVPFDRATSTLAASSTVTMTVNLPSCMAQIDAWQDLNPANPFSYAFTSAPLCTNGGGGGVPPAATSTLTVNVSGLNASDTASINVNDITKGTTNSTSTGNGSSAFTLPTNDQYAVSATTTNPNYSVATSTGCAGTISGNATCNITFTLNNSGGGGIPSTDADIAVTKTVDNANPVAGATVNYTITVTANGPATSTIVSAQDILPMGLSLVNASASVGAYDMSTGNWTIGTLGPNAVATLKIAAQVANNEAGQTITNTATVSELSSLVDQNPANNSSSVSINVQPANNGGGGGGGGSNGGVPTAEIGITKTVDNATPNAGDTINYTLTVTASGPAASPNVVATDLLPAGVTFDSASTSVGSYNSTTGTWTLGNVSPNSNPTLVITATVNSTDPNGETITNTATVAESNNVNDPLTTNNSSSVSIVVGGSNGGGGNVGTGGGGSTSGGGIGNGGGNGGSSTGGGQVLGASASCGLYLDQFIHPIRKDLNDPTEVEKLQEFLNMNLGTNLPITGFYGNQTIAAVNQFQVKYHIEVLQPWLAYGLPTEYTPTSYVYKTTQRWINLIMCSSLNLPIPQLP